MAADQSSHNTNCVACKTTNCVAPITFFKFFDKNIFILGYILIRVRRPFSVRYTESPCLLRPRINMTSYLVLSSDVIPHLRAATPFQPPSHLVSKSAANPTLLPFVLSRSGAPWSAGVRGSLTFHRVASTQRIRQLGVKNLICF